jgi:hypothetical protein
MVEWVLEMTFNSQTCMTPGGRIIENCSCLEIVDTAHQIVI